MKSNNNYKKVYITLLLSEASNEMLSISSKRSNRKKIQEATLRLEDHLKKYRSISELEHAIPLNKE
ncbi:TraY domain-containing protein [Legionella quinlivanii]|uniref:TraY domain-containing protein n=1 Tax=Legionella quinlivanii TaxID=45073 RepID=UPI000CDEF97A|nr:TraY domain-containing protein [Legionella quinlivanii]